MIYLGQRLEANENHIGWQSVEIPYQMHVWNKIMVIDKVCRVYGSSVLAYAVLAKRQLMYKVSLVASGFV